MVLSKNAILRSRAAWEFAHVWLVDELARRELDSPEVIEAIWDTFARLDAEFAEAAALPTDERTERVRRECEDSSLNLLDYFRKAYTAKAREVKA